MKKVALVLGAPTSGKTTYVDWLAAGTGGAVVRGSCIVPRLAKVFGAQRQLVPDEIFLPALMNKLKTYHDFSGLLIFENVPRTLLQAKFLEEWIRQRNRETHAIVLQLSREETLDRARLREMCPLCCISYHPTLKPPEVVGRCDQCYTALIRRGGDDEDLVEKGFDLFCSQREKIIEAFGHKLNLHMIDASGDMVIVYKHICEVLL